MNKSKYRYDSAKISRRKYNKKYYAKSRGRRNSNTWWTIGELIIVKEHLVCDSEIAELLGRSVAAVQTARHNIKKGKYNGIF